MSTLIRTFFIAVYKDGRRLPWLFMHQTQYKALESIPFMGYYKSESVKRAVHEIKEVVSGSKETMIIEEEWCSIKIEKDETTIEDDRIELSRFTIPSVEMLRLMEEWLDFLNAYENGEIPGLPYPPPSK
jgi:hypothetical protein